MKAKTKKSFAELSAHLADAKAELDTAITNTDVERTAELRTLIKSIQADLPIVEMAELKERLTQVDLKLQETEDSKKLLRGLIAQSKERLEQKLAEIQPFYEELNQLGLEMSFADNDAELLRMERREKRSRLFNLSDELRAESV